MREHALLGHILSFATMPKLPDSSGPTIVESYRDFEPPEDFRATVELLVKYVPAKYLVGLKTIVLTNRSALSRDRRRKKVWTRNRKVRVSESMGSYSRSGKSAPATVWLYVDNMLDIDSTWWSRGPRIRCFGVSEVLYHEIGHHIHSVHKPVHEGRENVAEDWRRRLQDDFFREHFGLSLPPRLQGNF
jgi:hypothetical protein